jgi:hypothetical protein
MFTFVTSYPTYSLPPRPAKIAAIAKIKQMVEEYENVEDDIDVSVASVSVASVSVASVPTNGKYICNGCNGAAHFRCSNCMDAKYCSKKCQTTDWKDHKKVCSTTKITLADVEKAYEESTYFPEIYALYPPEYRNDMIEGDVRIDYLIDVIEGYIDGVGMLREENFDDKNDWNDYMKAVDYYRNHTRDALGYVFDKIYEFEEDCY